MAEVIGIATRSYGVVKIHRFRLSVHLGQWHATCGNKAASSVEPMREGTVCRSCFKHGNLPPEKRS